MFTRRRVTVACGVVLVLSALALSHWFAYSQGMAAQMDRATRYADEASATHALDSATALEGGVQVLRRALEHPEAVAAEELRAWSENVARWRSIVEQIAVPYLRERGRDDLAERYEELAREAAALENQLAG